MGLLNKLRDGMRALRDVGGMWRNDSYIVDPVDPYEEKEDDDLYDDPRSDVERSFVNQLTNETDVQQLRRKAAEYFDIIERIETERDGLWQMYRVGVAHHLNAQSLLERRLMETRRQLGRAIAMINKMRAEKELPPLNKPGDLEPYEGEPVGTARKFADDMLALCREFPDRFSKVRPLLTEGVKERDSKTNGQSTKD